MNYHLGFFRELNYNMHIKCLTHFKCFINVRCYHYYFRIVFTLRMCFILEQLGWNFRGYLFRDHFQAYLSLKHTMSEYGNPQVSWHSIVLMAKKFFPTINWILLLWLKCIAPLPLPCPIGFCLKTENKQGLSFSLWCDIYPDWVKPSVSHTKSSKLTLKKKLARHYVMATKWSRTGPRRQPVWQPGFKPQLCHFCYMTWVMYWIDLCFIFLFC